MFKTGKEVRYLVIFLVQFLPLTGLRIYYELRANPEDALTALFDVIEGLAPIIVLVTATTVLLEEGGGVLAERYKQRKYNEGKAEGIKEGRGETNVQWREWYNRKMEAEAKGKPFNEPAPDERDGR